MVSAKEPILKVENVSKSFGGVQALKSGSFDLYRGEVVAIVGANGAGKSTLIKIVAGVHRPNSGKMFVKNQLIDQRNHTVAHMRRCGIEVVYQDLAVVENMSAPYNLFLGRVPTKFKFFVDNRKMIAKTKEILSLLKVQTVQSLDQPISEMSGGQQQSIAIGRAIAWGKEIVILDEPTAALGPNETREVERVINEIKSHGTGVILISHNLDQVVRTADRVVVVHHGVTSKEFNKAEVNTAELVRAITLG